MGVMQTTCMLTGASGGIVMGYRIADELDLDIPRSVGFMLGNCSLGAVAGATVGKIGDELMAYAEYTDKRQRDENH